MSGPETATTSRGAGRFGYCSWHHGHTFDARLVRAVDQGSGPRVPSWYACTDCRSKHGLVPLTEQPLPRAPQPDAEADYWTAYKALLNHQVACTACRANESCADGAKLLAEHGIAKRRAVLGQRAR